VRPLSGEGGGSEGGGEGGEDGVAAATGVAAAIDGRFGFTLLNIGLANDGIVHPSKIPSAIDIDIAQAIALRNPRVSQQLRETGRVTFELTYLIQEHGPVASVICSCSTHASSAGAFEAEGCALFAAARDLSAPPPLSRRTPLPPLLPHPPLRSRALFQGEVPPDLIQLKVLLDGVEPDGLSRAFKDFHKTGRQHSISYFKQFEVSGQAARAPVFASDIARRAPLARDVRCPECGHLWTPDEAVRVLGPEHTAKNVEMRMWRCNPDALCSRASQRRRGIRSAPADAVCPWCGQTFHGKSRSKAEQSLARHQGEVPGIPRSAKCIAFERDAAVAQAVRDAEGRE